MNAFKDINDAKIERQVEDAYNEALKAAFPGIRIEYPYGCDGYFEIAPGLGVVCEFKFDMNLKSKTDRSKILAQVVFYLKRFEQDGRRLPRVVFVGDRNECFILHTNDLIKWLDLEIDWKSAPSHAGDCAELLSALVSDESRNAYVFDVRSGFDFSAVKGQIESFATGVERKLHITEHNVDKVFKSVFCGKIVKDAAKIEANDLVGIFYGCVCDPENYCLHPAKKNTLMAGDMRIRVDAGNFKAFQKVFDYVKSPSQKKRLRSICDRLVADENRRRKGQFYTPTVFVDKAHEYASRILGADWKERSAVWDCCYDKETEFLSRTGWKKISEYAEGDMVMQYNADGTASFVKPLRYISQAYADDWVALKGSQLDVKCTKDHNFVVFNDKKKGHDIFKKPAIELYEKSKTVKNLHLNIPKTFSFDGPLEIDENILRLAVAINADGTYAPRTTLGNNKNRTARNTRLTESDTSVRDCFVICVKKARKAERLKTLLEKAGIEYVYAEYDGIRHFTFHFPFNPKHFPVEWYGLSKKSKAVIADEIFNWDGSIQQNEFENTRKSIRKIYTTSKKDDADFISFVLASLGYGVYWREDTRTDKTNYVLSPTCIKNAKISNANNVFELEKNEDGMCYCFEVPSGMLVVRRNGKIYISSNCCGTKNLTRDYAFSELYCSTLEQAELDISSVDNPEATSFQFDFLNDPLTKLPQGLLDSLKAGKELTFLINPPYGRSGTNAEDGGKAGITGGAATGTVMNAKMKEDKIGACSAQLFAQFLYRILCIKKEFNLKKVNIGLFCKPVFLTGSTYKKFRELFLKEFKYEDGFLFNAGHFEGAAANWGIDFTVWTAANQAHAE